MLERRRLPWKPAFSQGALPPETPASQATARRSVLTASVSPKCSACGSPKQKEGLREHGHPGQGRGRLPAGCELSRSDDEADSRRVRRSAATELPEGLAFCGKASCCRDLCQELIKGGILAPSVQGLQKCDTPCILVFFKMLSIRVLRIRPVQGLRYFCRPCTKHTQNLN